MCSAEEEILSKYTETVQVGRGGYAKVFIGNKRNKPIAIKVAEITDKDFRRVFEHEVKILKKLKHKNICKLYKTKKLKTPTTKQLFGIYELEKMDSDLLQYIIANRKLQPEVAKQIFLEICKAVQYCHSKGIAHLDLKPENVLLKFNRNKEIINVKICDFGFARKWDVRYPSQSYISIMPGERIGTAQYRAPEIQPYLLKNLSAESLFRVTFSLEKADVYSLGAILFVMLVGCFPNSFDQYENLLSTLEVSSVKVETGSEEIYDLVSKLMNSDFAERISLQEVLSHSWLKTPQSSNSSSLSSSTGN
jgi:serine/threonine protein kinase